MSEKLIHFATTNGGKVSSLQKALTPHKINVKQVNLEIPEPRIDDIREISKIKVLQAYRHIGKPCVAQDSGFYIDSLNGFPRTFVNFALETIGIEGLLQLTKKKPRDCHFKQSLAYYDSALKEPAYFESETRGRLAPEPLGEIQKNAWSKLWLVFIPDGHDKTIAQMDPEEYQRWREERSRDSFASKFAEWYAYR